MQPWLFEVGLRLVAARARFYCLRSGRPAAKPWGHPIVCPLCRRRLRVTFHGRIPNHVSKARPASRRPTIRLAASAGTR